MVTMICDRCKAEFTYGSEYRAEVAFSNHTCKGMRSIDDMPDDLLSMLAHGSISEADAWGVVDWRAKQAPTPAPKSAPTPPA